MAQDRIQINGEWYVKEQPTPVEPIQITSFLGCTAETDDYCWKATILTNDGGAVTDTVWIEFTDKTIEGIDKWKIDYWDSMQWIKGVLNEDVVAMTIARECMNERGVKQFQILLQHLVKIGWIK